MTRRHRLVAATLALTGALWGAAGYQVLWGTTPIVVTRRYVESPAGLLSLLPVRVVLHAIRVVEEQVAHRPFALSANHDWIGLAAAAAGALLLSLPFLLGLLAARLLRRPRTSHASPPA